MALEGVSLQLGFGGTGMNFDGRLSTLTQMVEGGLTEQPHYTMTLQRQLSDIANRLTSIASDMLQPTSTSTSDPAALAIRFREIIRGRRTRDRCFPPDLFADAAWDILLDLAAARLEGRHISISSAAIAASVPTATALRWLKQLVADGMVERVADMADKRRTFIQISDDGFARMMNFAKAFSERS